MNLAGASATTAAAGSAAADERLRGAARDLEAILIRQLIQSSGAFKGGEGPGATVRSGLFVTALADAVAHSGGLGLADELVRSLSNQVGGPPEAPSTALAPAPSSTRAAAAYAAAPGLPGVLPVSGRVTSAFGLRADPFTGAPERHSGVDVAAPAGTAILAPAAGVVRRAGPRGGYGEAVEIDHGNGLTTLYGHASELLVSEGDVVQAGQEIARVGSTGRSTGTHLHFEVRMGGRAVDPVRALKAYASRAEETRRSGSD